MTLLLAAVAALQSAEYARCLAEIDRSGFVNGQMLACATSEMDRADRALNREYEATIARLSPGARIRLRDSERAWIGARRKHCLAAERDTRPSPEINRMLCLINETVARLKVVRGTR